jgi:hypothetical protein
LDLKQAKVNWSKPLGFHPVQGFEMDWGSGSQTYVEETRTREEEDAKEDVRGYKRVMLRIFNYRVKKRAW